MHSKFWPTVLRYKILLFFGVVTLGTVGFGAKVFAAPGPYGTQLNVGYFNQKFDPDGEDVVPGGVTAFSLANFENEVESLARSTNTQKRVGAAFVINTMLGRSQNAAIYPLRAQDFSAWEAAVENPNIKIDFNEPLTFCTNSYWQNNVSDDAFFKKTGGGCWSPNEVYAGQLVGRSITFRDKATNKLLYAIRRACYNPVGDTEGLLPPPPTDNYNITVSVSGFVNGTPVSTAEAGDSVTFRYIIHNSGTTPSENLSCPTYKRTFAGFHDPPPGAAEVFPTPGPNLGCPPRIINPGATFTFNEPAVAATNNTTICRSVYVSPVKPAGGTRSDEACVLVVNKPYVKVFGGDVSAGNSFNSGASACTPVVNKGGIVAWNKGTAGAYTGGGSQFAAMALLNIKDFSSAQANSWHPTGLSFANTSTNVGSGIFGGSFGAASCIPDYFSTLATTPGPIQTTLPPNVTAMSGAYNITGNISLTGGNVTPGQRVQLFVDGNVYITSNITYAGPWQIKQTPLFEMIVKGNIYVKNTVSQLDGVYIAQPHNLGSPTDGNIYTCATGPTTAAPLNSNLFATCNTRLDVNGIFAANQIHLLRTAATLSQSNASETSASNTAAESFSYSPAFWIMQPPTTTPSASSKYDSVTELPPIL